MRNNNIEVFIDKDDIWIFRSYHTLMMFQGLVNDFSSVDNLDTIGDTVFICQRGQSIRSVDHWCSLWDITPNALDHFLLKVQDCGYIRYNYITTGSIKIVCVTMNTADDPLIRFEPEDHPDDKANFLLAQYHDEHTEYQEPF